jgi:hypothetical protein
MTASVRISMDGRYFLDNVSIGGCGARSNMRMFISRAMRDGPSFIAFCVRDERAVIGRLREDPLNETLFRSLHHTRALGASITTAHQNTHLSM